MKTKIYLFVLLISLLLGFNATTMKADTIDVYLTVPDHTENFCQDINAFDTFIIHKNQYFGTTMWYINGIPAGSGDSFVYTPVSVGSFLISSTWNYNEYGVHLNLYSGAPAPATFTASGPINASGDTIWMCGGSVTVNANASGDESYTWYGPAGFTPTSSGNPISLSIPGAYSFVRTNPCDTTTNSFVLIQSASTAPNLGGLVAKCNDGSATLIDAGPGYTSYHWNTGETTQSISVNTTGTYTVTVTSPCIGTATASKVVDYETYSLPVVSATDTNFCYGIVVPITLNATYDTYQWQDGITSTSTFPATETGQYFCIVTQGACTATSNFFDLTFFHPYEYTVLCIATVDPIQAHNRVVLENTQNVRTDHYNIYRENGSYLLLGTVQADNSPSLQFVDMTSVPAQQAYRYKVSAVDTCGNESSLSIYHSTLKINSNPGTGGGVDLTVAEHYLVENMSFTPSYYYIYIDSVNNGSLHLMDSIPGYLNAYTVVQPHAGATYLFGIKPPWAGCNGTKSVGNGVALSNKSAIISHAWLQSLDHIAIGPNPSEGVFTVSGLNAQHAEITVTDISGRKLLTTNATTFDVGQYGAGIYFISIATTAGSTQKKVEVIR